MHISHAHMTRTYQCTYDMHMTCTYRMHTSMHISHAHISVTVLQKLSQLQ